VPERPRHQRRGPAPATQAARGKAARPGPDAAQPEPKPKDRYNFTDPESRIMKSGGRRKIRKMPAPDDPFQNGGAILFSSVEDEVRHAARTLTGCSADVLMYSGAFMKPIPILAPLVVLSLAIMRPALAAEPAAPEPFHLYAPEKAWSLDIDLQDFVISGNTMSKDLLSRELMANHPGNGLTVSASLAPADATAVELRDQTLARLRRMELPFSELKTYEKDHRLIWRTRSE